MPYRAIKSIFTLFAVFILLACFHHQVVACVGARALSLGGAFTGIADDTEATYWNPAGLAKASSGIYTMHNLNHRREFNYDDYVGISFKRGGWGVGGQYIGKSTSRRAWVLTSGHGVQLGEIDDESTWLQVGAGRAWSFILIGANLRYVKETQEITVDSIVPPLHTRSEDSAWACDIGLLTEFGPLRNKGRSRMFSAGVLVQDLNSPEILGQEYIVNVRPGAGFRPSDGFLLSIEIYDAACQYFDQPQVRIGAEWIVSPPASVGEFVLRGGVYHMNEPGYRAVTGGLGYLRPFSGNFSLGMDYAFMSWEEANKVTHLLSLVCKF
ncbi:MAG: hypothetical protein ACMUIL_10670 [bacterium]